MMARRRVLRGFLLRGGTVSPWNRVQQSVGGDVTGCSPDQLASSQASGFTDHDRASVSARHPASHSSVTFSETHLCAHSAHLRTTVITSAFSTRTALMMSGSAPSTMFPEARTSTTAGGVLRRILYNRSACPQCDLVWDSLGLPGGRDRSGMPRLGRLVEHRTDRRRLLGVGPTRGLS